MPETLVDMFFNNAEKYGDKTALMSKEDGEYRKRSYTEIADDITHIAYGLKKMGVEKGDCFGILAENRPEWALVDMANLSLGAVTIPVYPTLSENQVEYVLNDSETKIIMVSQPEHLEAIEHIFNNLKTLRRIITLFDHGKSDAGHLITLDELIEKGKQHRQEEPEFLNKRRSELVSTDLVSVLYTSGTTGNPKGVMLNNTNFLSNIKAGLAVIPVSDTDLFLSFLPLCHIFERCLGYYLPLYLGATIAYAENIATVGDNMREVYPTIMISVPRLYEKIYNLIQDNVSKGSAVKKMIFNWSVRAGKRHFDQKRKGKVSALTSRKYKIADKLVFSKLRARTGGKIRFFASGGAPLSADIGKFFAYAGLIVLEGYGLTETSPIITVNPPEDYRFGTVGKPLPGVEVKIGDDGEILSRGPHIMMGYYKNDEATKEAIDAEGWFYTGDIGFIDRDNYLTITDRKKNIIVTSGGKNIAPAPIENKMITSRYIEQILMIGDRRQFPAALVVPAFANLEDHYQLQNVTFKSHKEMVKDPRTVELIQNEIDRLSEELSNYERIKKVILLDEEFTQENGVLTPTLKIKRQIVEKKFEKKINQLYESSEPNGD
ncbi:AMP-dependent synthetase/ligase [candidate division KSB1 bacterium]